MTGSFLISVQSDQIRRVRTSARQFHGWRGLV